MPVTTQVITVDGTDSGKLSDVKQFDAQDGKTVKNPQYSLNGKQHNSTTNDMCKVCLADTKNGTYLIGKGGWQAVG